VYCKSGDLPTTKRDKMDALNKYLEDLAQKIRPEMVQNHLNHHMFCLKRLVQFLEQNGLNPMTYKTYTLRRQYNEAARSYEGFLVGDYAKGYTGEINKEKADKDLLERSENEVETILNNWKGKVIEKVSPVLDGKTFTVREIYQHSSSGLIDCRVGFNLDQGQFTIQTQIVWAVSKLGNQFARYPLTFHNAVVDGKDVKSPNQGTVLAAFGSKFVHPKGFKVGFFIERPNSKTGAMVEFKVSGWVKDGQPKITRVTMCSTGRTIYLNDDTRIFYEQVAMAKEAAQDESFYPSEEMFATAKTKADEIVAENKRVEDEEKAAEIAKINAKAAAKEAKEAAKRERAKKAGRKTQMEKLVAKATELGLKVDDTPSEKVRPPLLRNVHLPSGVILMCCFDEHQMLYASVYEAEDGYISYGPEKITKLIKFIEGAV